jgi:CHAT domain-containing protein
MLIKNISFVFFLFSLIITNAQNNLFKADSLYSIEEYEKSLEYRVKVLKLKSKNKNEVEVQRAKLLLTNYYIKKNKTNFADTIVINQVFQIIRNLPTSQPKNDILVEATVALSNLHYNYDNPSKSLEILQSLLNLNPLSTTSKVLLYYNFGSIYDNYDSTYKKSIPYFLNGIELAKSKEYYNKNVLALLYNDLGLVYEWVGQMDKNLNCYKEAHDIWWKNYKKEQINNNIACLGNLITATADYGLDIEAKKFLDTLLYYFEWVKQATKNNIIKGRKAEENYKKEYYILLMAIRCYSAINEEKQMLNTLQKISSLYTNATSNFKKEFAQNLFEAHEEVALYYRLKDQSQKAIDYFNKANNYISNDFYRMKSAANLGITYASTKQISKALQNLNNAISIIQKIRPNSVTYFGLLATKAEALHYQKNYGDAINVLDSLFALNFDTSYNNKNIDKLPFSFFKNKINHTQIKILVKCGKVYLGKFQMYNKAEDIKKATHFYLLAAQLFKTYYSREFYSSYMNELNNEINYGLLQTSINASSKTIENSLNLIENNNYQNLWKKFQLKYSASINIPDSLSDARSNIFKQLENLEFEVNKNKEKIEIQKKITLIEDKIASINKSYLSFSNTNFNVKFLQDKLSTNELVVRYFATESIIFAVTISQKKLEIFQLSNTNTVNSLIDKLKTDISNISNGFNSNTKTLYQLLFAKLSIENKYKNIIVVPDGSLNFLPFEILYNTTNNNYVVSEKNLSYAYSLPLWLTQTSLSNTNKSVVAFAPNYNLPNNTNAIITRGNNYNLANAITEANTIALIYKGTLYEDSNATVNNFIKSTGKYSIYHLAMHASMNNKMPEKSHLIFANNQKLFFNQLYKLNIPSSMMVLSACNTGIGAMQEGEGLQSLSRAITYSGVQSAVFSLWEVPDKETSEIMIAFYENLAKGQSKAEALANAKRVFLRKNPAKQHPFYWAGFVVNGNTKPIDKNKNWIWYLISISTIIGFITIRNLKKQKRINP